MRAVMLCLGMLWAAPLAAQTDRWERQAAVSLAKSDAALREEGWSPVGVAQFGALNAGSTGRVVLPGPLSGRLAVVGVCDADCGRLGLIIGDDRGYDLGADRSAGTTPVVEFVPRSSGTHTARIFMDGCQVSPCRYGLRVYRRPLTSR